MRLGIDVDGCLADFNHGFIQRCIKVTGRDLFGKGYIPTTWAYPQVQGYTAVEEDEVWESIKEDELFWQTLPALPGAREALSELSQRVEKGDDIYFITARPGVNAKLQTEVWLYLRGFVATPTVLVTSNKGAAASLLSLDKYIDDKFENCASVRDLSPLTQVYMMNQPWNDKFEVKGEGIKRVSYIGEMFN